MRLLETLVQFMRAFAKPQRMIRTIIRYQLSYIIIFASTELTVKFCHRKKTFVIQLFINPTLSVAPFR